ncbi:MAG TPA: bifunctional riboflavin kinase/FAD synthetase [Candidatus Kapabacteria bacterium]
MVVTWGIDSLEYIAGTAATLGSYDGVHLGHNKIIDRLVDVKNERLLSRSLVITFHPHPQEVLRKNDSQIQLLTTIDERIDLLGSTGIDEILVLEFSKEFSQTPYEQFFRKTLVQKIGVEAMVVGFNHAFGKNREGDTEHLKQLASTESVYIEEVDPLIIDGVSVSSTKIRHALLEGNISTANHYLGRQYGVEGIVVKGDAIGRELGYPTINLSMQANKLIPTDGVYSGLTIIDGIRYPAAISIGTRPTVTDSQERVVEAFLLDFSGDLYEKKVILEFQNFLRSQVKFDSLEVLRNQISLDVVAVRSDIS